MDTNGKEKRKTRKDKKGREIVLPKKLRNTTLD